MDIERIFMVYRVKAENVQFLIMGNGSEVRHKLGARPVARRSMQRRRRQSWEVACFSKAAHLRCGQMPQALYRDHRPWRKPRAHRRAGIHADETFMELSTESLSSNDKPAEPLENPTRRVVKLVDSMGDAISGTGVMEPGFWENDAISLNADGGPKAGERRED